MKSLSEYKEKEVDFESSDWYEQIFRNDMISLLDNEDEKTNILLSRYLTSIVHFFEHIYNEGKLDNGDIIDLMQILNIRFGHEIFGKRNDTYQSSLRIGLVVELLFQNGLPRQHAIPAVSQWLNIKERTVRDHNETYRKRFGKGEVTGFTIVLVQRMSFFGAIKAEDNPTIEEIFKQNTNFPRVHPHAMRAYRRCIKFLEEDELLSRWYKNFGMAIIK